MDAVGNALRGFPHESGTAGRPLGRAQLGMTRLQRSDAPVGALPEAWLRPAPDTRGGSFGVFGESLSKKLVEGLSPGDL
jgi:hypothetical protein